MPESPKKECLSLMGIGLTAAALIITSLSFLYTFTPTEEKTDLFLNTIGLLKTVALFFLYSSIISLLAFCTCYIYDLSMGKLKAELIAAVGLAIAIICSLSILFWGIIQLITVLQLLWG